MRLAMCGLLAMALTFGILEAASNAYGNTTVTGAKCLPSPAGCGGCMLGYDATYTPPGGGTGSCVGISCPASTAVAFKFNTCQAQAMTGACSQSGNEGGQAATKCPVCTAIACTAGGPTGCDKSKCGASTGTCTGGANYPGTGFPSC